MSKNATYPAAFGVEGQYFICGSCGKSIPILQIEGQCICGRRICKKCGSLFPLCASCGWTVCRYCAYQSRKDQKWYHRDHRPSECLIVTACFGSPYSEEVQCLRTFRDETVLKTYFGKGMMNVLERIYYSFSPRVATYLKNYSATRNVVKSALVTPLLQSLSTFERLSKSFTNNELRVVFIAWLSSMSLTIGLTFWKFISFIKRK